MKISIRYISAERFWEHDKSGPGQVHVSTNVNILGGEEKGDSLLVPFVATVDYTPSVAQISIKGHALVSGSQEELQKLKAESIAKRPPPPVLLRAIMGATITEATIVSRSLHIPPPVPLPPVPSGPKVDKERPSYVG